MSWRSPAAGTRRSVRSPRTSGSPSRVCATGCMPLMSRTVPAPAEQAFVHRAYKAAIVAEYEGAPHGEKSTISGFFALVA